MTDNRPLTKGVVQMKRCLITDKTRKVLLIAAIVIIGLVIFSQLIKNRGGVNVKCQTEYKVEEGLISYRQDDPKWKDLYLGESEFTMQSSGCITTSIATAISESENPLDPGQLVAFLSDNGVFDNDGNMQWGKLDELPGFNAEVYGKPDADAIDECLAQGHYPIVKVHRRSLFSYHHFVLIIGAENGEYICMDPLKDSFTKLKDYGNRIYSVRCVWYGDY